MKTLCMIAAMFSIAVIAGCSKPDPDVMPVACFTASANNVKVNTVVNFTDCSTDATNWSWQFGDGQTSIQASPSHTYTAAGSYTVQLTATNGSGTNTTSKTIVVANGGCTKTVVVVPAVINTPTTWDSCH